MVGTHNLRIRARYAGYSDITDLDFTVVIYDPCATATISKPANVVETYTVGGAALNEIGNWSTSPTTNYPAGCPFTSLTLTMADGTAAPGPPFYLISAVTPTPYS